MLGAARIMPAICSNLNLNIGSVRVRTWSTMLDLWTRRWGIVGFNGLIPMVMWFTCLLEIHLFVSLFSVKT